VTATAAASTAAPKYMSRNAGFVLATALMPRIAVIAWTGPVRSSPRMTKVENTYIIPAAAALVIAATMIRMTTGLRFMSGSQPPRTETIHRFPSWKHV